MKLRKDSFSAKFYKWFYILRTSRSLPNNLCDYFWKLTAAFIVTIVVFPVFAFEWITMAKCGYSHRETTLNGRWLGISMSLSLELVVGFALALAIQFPLHILIIVVGTAVVALIGSAIVYTGKKLSRPVNNTVDSLIDNTVTTVKESMTLEFFKSVKNRYCPRISWR